MTDTPVNSPRANLNDSRLKATERGLGLDDDRIVELVLGEAETMVYCLRVLLKLVPESLLADSWVRSVEPSELSDLKIVGDFVEESTRLIVELSTYARERIFEPEDVARFTEILTLFGRSVATAAGYVASANMRSSLNLS